MSQNIKVVKAGQVSNPALSFHEYAMKRARAFELKRQAVKKQNAWARETLNSLRQREQTERRKVLAA